MKAILTNVTPISGKDSRKWVVLTGIAENGEVVNSIVSQEQADAFKVHEMPKLSKEEIKGLFEEFQAVTFDFDQRGRLVGVAK